MTTVSNTYDLDALSKSHLAKVASFLGEKADWARNSKEAIIAMIESHDEEALLSGLRHIGATAEDIDNWRIETVEAIPSARDAIAAMDDDVPVPAVRPAAAAAAPQASPDQVAEVSKLLANLLATNKGALDIEQVTKIAHTVMAQNIHDAIEKARDTGASNYDAILSKVEKMIAAGLDNLPARTLDVTSNAGTFTVEGRQHRQFDELLTVISCGLKIEGDTGHTSALNIWLRGVAGTGKTTAASNCAVALGMAFFTNGSIANKYELTGFIDAHGKLVRTPFRDAWEHGGVYLFDEVDGSHPAAVLAFNAGLANGIMAFPDGMIKRHANCIIIAAANTAGQGATAEYVGRAKQDAAFLDRFVMIDWMIDEELETHFSGNADWAFYVQGVRRRVEAKGLKVLVTPRATLFGAQLLRGGKLSKARVIDMVLKKGMTSEQWNMVK